LTLDAGAAAYLALAACYERLGRPDAAARIRARLASARQAAFGVDPPSGKP
jgi:hypothetical protein